MPQLSCGRSSGPVNQEKHWGVVQAVQVLTDHALEKWAWVDVAAILGISSDEKEIWKGLTFLRCFKKLLPLVGCGICTLHDIRREVSLKTDSSSTNSKRILAQEAWQLPGLITLETTSENMFFFVTYQN